MAEPYPAKNRYGKQQKHFIRAHMPVRIAVKGVAAISVFGYGGDHTAYACFFYHCPFCVVPVGKTKYNALAAIEYRLKMFENGRPAAENWILTRHFSYDIILHAAKNMAKLLPIWSVGSVGSPLWLVHIKHQPLPFTKTDCGSWSVGSVGRAHRSHRWGHWFESSTDHQISSA